MPESTGHSRRSLFSIIAGTVAAAAMPVKAAWSKPTPMEVEPITITQDDAAITIYPNGVVFFTTVKDGTIRFTRIDLRRDPNFGMWKRERVGHPGSASRHAIGRS